jgi:hypothetical protein
VENHIRIGGTVNTSAAKPTIHITLSCNKITPNMMRMPVFIPAVNIIFSERLRPCNPINWKNQDTIV